MKLRTQRNYVSPKGSLNRCLNSTLANKLTGDGTPKYHTYTSYKSQLRVISHLQAASYELKGQHDLPIRREADQYCHDETYRRGEEQRSSSSLSVSVVAPRKREYYAY